MSYSLSQFPNFSTGGKKSQNTLWGKQVHAHKAFEAMLI